MPRRVTRNITGLVGTGHKNPQELWRVFQCISKTCNFILQVSEREVDIHSENIRCPVCETINPTEHVKRAEQWKYCRICENLQPLDYFHQHKRMSSGRQSECKFCKNLKINPILNPLRTTDQHREASEKRRLYGILASEQKIDVMKVWKTFKGTCFKCGKVLKVKNGDAALDHTLPIKFLWPQSLGPTLLCTTCNGRKAEKWPNKFYSKKELQRLAVLTGILYEMLNSDPYFNPQAIAYLKGHMDEFLEKWIRYPDEIKRLRRSILQIEGIDIYDFASQVPDFLRDES
ncbi:MAG TPA: hypothetical protein VNO70_08145 [Blastocatellia bacterium]|nr:hypothetical protein [Blastocatellia bacterium]